MNNQVTLKILEILIHYSKVNINYLVKKINISKREIKDNIIQINSLLKKDLIDINKSSISLVKDQLFFDYHSKKQRYKLIITKLSIDNSYHSLQKLANFCLVSKNTTLKDIKEINAQLKNKKVNLAYKRKYGYFIEGEEFLIRKILVTNVKEILTDPLGVILLIEKRLVEESETFRLRNRLKKVEERIGIKLTDEQIEELPYILQLTLKRARKFNYNWSFYMDKYNIKQTFEFDKIKEMFWDYTYLKEEDVQYLSLLILASNRVESALYISESDEIVNATEEFLSNLEEKLALNLSEYIELKEKIILHIRPAIYRNLLGFQITNPLVEKFIKENEKIYNIVLQSINPFEKIILQKLSREEIVYLSMILISLIYTQEKKERIFTAVVLCRNGVSISKLLLNTLQSIFPEISFIGAFSVRQFKKNNKEVDFIFSTVPIGTDLATTFIISSVLYEQEIKKLKMKVNQAIKNSNDKISRKLVQEISEYIPQDKEKIIENKIALFFEEHFNNEKNKKEEVNKHELFQTKEFDFSVNNIQIVNKDIKWNNLIYYSMQPLLNRGSVTQEYIKKTEESFYKNFTKMKIGPKVYIPHTRPEYGALKIDFQILILKNNIRAPTGELIQIIIAFSPSSYNKHVSTLLKINNLFRNKRAHRLIMQADNEHAVKKILED